MGFRNADSWLRVRKLCWSACRPRAWRSLRAGVAPTIEHFATLERVAPRTVVDAGANRGQFSLAVREVSSDTKIVAFEPLPEIADRLNRSFVEDPNFTCYPVGLGAEAEQKSMIVAKASDSSSFFEPTNRQVAMYPKAAPVRRQDVRVERLDLIVQSCDLERPSLLKIDVQGAEMDVLSGAAGVLSSFDAVLVELSFVELYAGQPLAGSVICWLAERGFDLVDISQISRDSGGAAVQADILFLRKVTHE